MDIVVVLGVVSGIGVVGGGVVLVVGVGVGIVVCCVGVYSGYSSRNRVGSSLLDCFEIVMIFFCGQVMCQIGVSLGYW